MRLYNRRSRGVTTMIRLVKLFLYTALFSSATPVRGTAGWDAEVTHRLAASGTWRRLVARLCQNSDGRKNSRPQPAETHNRICRPRFRPIQQHEGEWNWAQPVRIIIGNRVAIRKAIRVEPACEADGVGLGEGARLRVVVAVALVHVAARVLHPFGQAAEPVLVRQWPVLVQERPVGARPHDRTLAVRIARQLHARGVRGADKDAAPVRDRQHLCGAAACVRVPRDLQREVDAEAVRVEHAPVLRAEAGR